MYFLGVDPSKAASGWAVIEKNAGRERILDSGTVAATAGAVAAVAEKWRGLVVLAAIELQYMGKNPKTMATLVEARARWQQALEERGVAVELVHPSTWHAAMLGPSFVAAKREAVKARSALVARGLFRRELPEDEAEAALIAAFRGRLSHLRIIAKSDSNRA